MGKRWYGNLCNRFEEGKNYTHRDIQEGDDITMYYWSDRHCYYITKVIDQKHIFVKEYEVCADRSKAGGMGHQDWLYFKTRKEHNKYLNDWFEAHPEEKWDTYQRSEDEPKEPREEEWVFRYGKWKSVTRWTKATIDEVIANHGWCGAGFNEKEQAKLDAGEEICKYHTLEPISFGVKSYYHDWEF